MSMGDGNDFEPISLVGLWTRLKERTSGHLLSSMGFQETEEEKTERCRDAFLRAAGVSKDVFLSRATAGLPPIIKSDIIFTEKSREDRFEVQYSGDGFSDMYTLNFSSRSVGAGHVVNERSDRTTGRHMFALRAIMGICVDFEIMGFNASDMMGAFNWAKTGAHVHPSSFFSLTNDMLARLKTLQGVLPRSEYDHASKLVRDGDVMGIAHLSRPIADGDILWDEMRRVEDKYAPTHQAYVARGFFVERSITLGQYLLCGLSYDALINLKDTQQLKKVEAYTRINIRETAKRMRANNGPRT